MRNVSFIGLVGLVVSACSVQIGSGGGSNAPRAAAPPPPAPAPAPAPAAPAAPHYAAMGHSHSSPAPAPAPAGPASHVHPGTAVGGIHEPLNIAVLQDLIKRSPKACGFAEVSPGNWIRIDCHAYQPSAKAIAHLSARKAHFVQAHETNWKGWLKVSTTLKGAGFNGRLGAGGLGGGGGAVKGGERANHQGGGGGSVKAENFPGTVDHRGDRLEGAIKDQGRVGSCTAFSLSAVIDNQAIRAGKEQPDNFDQSASPIHVWGGYGIPQMGTAADASLGRTIATNGTWVGQSDKEACKFASPMYEECGATFSPPFVPGTWRDDKALSAKWDKAQGGGTYKIAGFEKLQTLPPNMEELVGALASGNDLWIAMKIDGYGWSNSKMHNGVIPDWSNPTGGHAIVMSGYRDTPSGRQFLIHNSWGTSWGDGGYAWVSEAMVQKYMHYAYKVKLSDGVKKDDVTDDDCAPDELVDIVQGICALICGDGSRPSNGCPKIGGHR